MNPSDVTSAILSTENSPKQSPDNAPLYKRARGYIYQVLHTIQIESNVEKYVKGMLIFLILLNVAITILESVPKYEITYGGLFETMELITVIIFAIEYILRVWSIVESDHYQGAIKGRVKFIFSFYSLVDLCIFLPIIFPRILTTDLELTKMLRLLRLIRLLKIGEYSQSLSKVKKIFRRKRHDMGISFAIIGLLIVIFGSGFYFFEHATQPAVITDIPTTIWWGVAKFTKLSYVQISPLTTGGTMCDLVLSFLGLGFFALPSAMLAAGFMEEFQLERKAMCCPHCQKEFKESESLSQSK